MNLTPYFNPRSPHRERRLPVVRSRLFYSHFNPRSPHRERQLAAQGVKGSVTFQSTLPSQGATKCHDPDDMIDTIFQSTLPSQGATKATAGKVHTLRHFNPRSPHRERPAGKSGLPSATLFQSTLPSQGATQIPAERESMDLKFQSTLPSQGATLLPEVSYAKSDISIHAPLTGSD